MCFTYICLYKIDTQSKKTFVWKIQLCDQAVCVKINNTESMIYNTLFIKKKIQNKKMWKFTWISSFIQNVFYMLSSMFYTKFTAITEIIKDMLDEVVAFL